MTENEKCRALQHILKRIEAANKQGLKATELSWKDYYRTVKSRPASEMILAKQLNQEETDMVNINTIFSGYLTAADIDGRDPICTIEEVTVKKFENDGRVQVKLDITFAEEEKHLLCNVTNATTIGDVFGSETDAWVGRKIQLYVDPNVMFGGRRTPSIRVRTGKKRSASAPAPAPRKPEPEFDDSTDLSETF